MDAVLYTDGGARGNPGPAAIGVILQLPHKEPTELAEVIGTATNNVAEYRALIRGLELAAEKGVTHLDCRLDSELVVRQLNGAYKVRDANLLSLFALVQGAARRFQTVRFTAVPRAENRAADRLVNQALDQDDRRPGGA